MDKYHHGSLKNDLIEKGLQLLNSEGVNGFSIRKVADLCGVSHAAPYRHFKNKEDLISEITGQISKEFVSAIEQSMKCCGGDIPGKILSVGVTYVEFLVSHPEHFKFIFLTNHDHPIRMRDNTFVELDRWPVNLFRSLLLEYRQTAGLPGDDWAEDAMSLWALLHGTTTLLINNTVSIEGDYRELVTKFLRTRYYPGAE